jgi:glutathione peroxidase
MHTCKLSFLFLVSIFLFLQQSSHAQNDTVVSFHSFSIKKAGTGVINFADYAGKKILIVNTASLDVANTQLQQLQQLQNQYGSKVQVIAFPCSDFRNLEPESNNKIDQKYTQNFGVSFPVTIKVGVLKGSKHKIYKWLTRKALNGRTNSIVTDNFQKYLIDEQGQLMGIFDKTITPLSAEIINAINL